MGVVLKLYLCLNNIKMKYDLLKELCSVHAPSGDEELMTKYILNYVKKNAKSWKTKPKVFAGKGFQNNVILVFGKPRTAIFAHIDSIGFTARYSNGLVKVGGPRAEAGWHLVGEDSKGKIDGILELEEKDGQKSLKLKYKRVIDTGTFLTFKPNFRETKTDQGDFRRIERAPQHHRADQRRCRGQGRRGAFLRCHGHAGPNGKRLRPRHLRRHGQT